MYYIGIDLGGTNIAAGIVDENGKILIKDSVPTKSERPADEIIKDMAFLAKKLISDLEIDESDVSAIGVGSPGMIDNKNGVVVYACNLPFENTSIKDGINKYINIPVNVENDANAAAYGEYVASGAKVDDFLAVTLGTGVGGGIIINRKIFRGFNGAAGEVGHTVIVNGGEKCGCGRNGCWEAYASVTGLVRQSKAEMEKNPDSLMHKIAKEEGEVNGKVPFGAAKAGDESALKVVKQYIEYVAEGVTDMVNIFQPELLVIGGGISKQGEYLLAPIREYVAKNGYNKQITQTKIEAAKLFNDAGIIGAAMAAKN